MKEYVRVTRHCILSFLKRYCCFHVFPDFLIIGVQKGGTRFLYEHLEEHPYIRMGKRFVKKRGKWKLRNEIHFFDRYSDKGLGWYRSKFAILPHEYFSKNGKKILFGEKTPEYVCDPSVPEQVFRIMPDVKLLLLLRNPVSRAYSQYLMEVRKKQRGGSFEEAVDAGLYEFYHARGQADEIQSMANQRSKTWGGILARGIYIEQIERWMNYFPREQMKIIKSEDMFEDPMSVYRDVIDFLGLPEWMPHSFVNRKARLHEPMRGEIQRRLNQFYRPYNEKLYEFLGRDLNWD